MLILMSMHETLVQWECLRIMILDGPKHSHSFFWGKPEDPEKNLLTWALQNINCLTSSFFDLFSPPPPIFFFRLFPLSYFLYLLLPHITSKMPMLQFKCQLSISPILSCTAILWGFFSVSGTAIFSFRQSGTACSVFRIVGTANFFFSFEILEHLLPDGLYIWICFRTQTFYVPNITQMNSNFALTRLH